MFHQSLFLLLCTIVTFTYGMDCTYGQSNNIIDKTINSCPGIFQDQSKSYCCIDIASESTYCCDAQEFALKTGLGIVIPAVIAISVVVCAIIFCISCLCCTCCPWYKRRHRGTVYGQGQGPNAVQVIQQVPTAQMSRPVNSNAYAYPVHQIAMPTHGQPPPQYTPEGYVKQAPYNPNYGL